MIDKNVRNWLFREFIADVLCYVRLRINFVLLREVISVFHFICAAGFILKVSVPAFTKSLWLMRYPHFLSPMRM